MQGRLPERIRKKRVKSKDMENEKGIKRVEQLRCNSHHWHAARAECALSHSKNESPAAAFMVAQVSFFSPQY